MRREFLMLGKASVVWDCEFFPCFLTSLPCDIGWGGSDSRRAATDLNNIKASLFLRVWTWVAAKTTASGTRVPKFGHFETLCGKSGDCEQSWQPVPVVGEREKLGETRSFGGNLRDGEKHGGDGDDVVMGVVW